ncbi:hypothetical protein [Streptomyces sp. NRRL S-448]|uniref:hypothetical protein n=1 Tax=Streptomyces sp. NRRL S-448 TaxID=1463907 RepID=UPI000A9FCD9A
MPAYVHPHARWDLSITGTDDAAGIECTISAVDGEYTRSARVQADGDDRLRATLTVPDTGLYRVTVRSDQSHTLTQLVFAGPDGTRYLDE